MTLTPRGASLDSSFYRHYNSGVEKNRLLSTGSNSLEFYRTKEILERFLPQKRIAIIDVGGGPGRYSFWLASKGHTVHLVDVVPLHVRQAKEVQKRSRVRLASVTLGEARDLDFEERVADMVLLFGPLYHLVRKRERLKALAEAHRVLRPGGLLFAAAISRFTSALDGSNNGFIQDPAFMKIIKRDLKTGQHRNPKNVPEYFTTSFFHHPRELREEIIEAGFKSINVYALTGFAWLLHRLKQYWTNPVLRNRLLSILRELEQEPSIIGVSDHRLATARK
jgi:ubiquinone/menaquinone biosynthesis C-methylase UbiE